MKLFLKIIKYLPVVTLKFMAGVILKLAANRRLEVYLLHKERKILHKLKKLERILVISDINIGDAVNIQTAVEALKYYFNNCKIDYAYNFTVEPVISKNPSISKSYPIFNNGTVFSDINRKQIYRVLMSNKYDLIINFCPFLSKKDLKASECPVIIPILLIVNMLKAIGGKKGTASLSLNIAEYISQLIISFPEEIKPPVSKYQYKGNKVYLSGRVISKRNSLLDYVGISLEDTIVFLNPDTSNPYTHIEPDLQKRLILKLIESPKIDFLLIGAGHNFKNIELSLIKDIPHQLREKIITLSRDIPLDLYASLVDISSAYITGDTGPMHVAAARKVCVGKNTVFINRTSIVSMFKATESAIYGYDSLKLEYMRANQKAPSRIFEAQPSCKNITCSIQRLIKNCTGNRCYFGSNIDRAAEYILENIHFPKRIQAERNLHSHVF